MNHKERYELSRGLAKSMKQAGIGQNYLHRQLFRYFSGNSPIWYDDNPDSYIQNAYEFNADVYSIINHILRSISSIPPVVYEVSDTNKAQKYYRLKYKQRNGANSNFQGEADQLKEQAFEEVPDSDLAKLIERPNPLQAWPEFVENLLGFKFITGNTYAHGVELSDGRFGEMWVMPAQFTKIIADKSLEGLIRSYILDVFGFHEQIPAETVMHLKYWNPDYSYQGSHLYGMSPLKAARRIIRNSNDGQTALSKAFQNMGAAGMVFPDDDDVEELTAEQQARLQKYFDQQGGNPSNYKSVLATSTKMGYVPFGMSPVDMEILSSISESRRALCNIYGFPSELLNDPENKTRANKNESRKQLYMDIAIPECERFYSELNRWLVPRFNKVDGKQYHIDYDVSGIEALAEDMGAKSEWLDRAWWIPPNVKLEEMKYDRIDDPMFDEPWIGMDKIPLSQMGMGAVSDEELKAMRDEYGE